MGNFHLPLPDNLHEELRRAALRMKRPATEIAREGIAHWLRLLRRRERQAAVQQFALAMAGTELDLDPELEAVGVELLADDEVP
jgi:hypothetical protein